MIVSSAPLRITFSGGGSDYKNFFQNNGGEVLGTAINKRVYVIVNSLSKFSDEKIRFTYKVTESVTEVSNLKHPVMREVLKLLGINSGINIATFADLPGKTGLGSSSAFTVAALKACSMFTGDNLSNQEIIDLAYFIEREVLGESGGIQDYLHAVNGSFKLYSINKSGEVFQSRLDFPKLHALIEDRIALIKFGEERLSKEFAEITEISITNESIKAIQLSSEIAKSTYDSIKMTEDTEQQFNLIARSIEDNWNVKKQFQKLPETYLDSMLNKLKIDGAISAKLCGAGKSGFLLVVFKNKNLRDLYHGEFEKIKIDNSGLVGVNLENR